MKKLQLLIVATLLCLAVTAQKNGSIKGILFDTAANQPVASATITILQKKDSSLVTFTMTDNKGRFELAGLANGDYRLLVTHVNYHNINKYFTINDAGKNKDMGNIAMTDHSKVLEEVTVTAEAPPVTLVGDTVQYNANSFKVQPNGNVEQLLKKLPGVKVEKDGTVKAQGQEVKRVLVDGKEFFGNDPKIATRNLPADAVDKVQVYDRMSDQAQLTGFDDGNSEKTINLKLKKDKKKGLFGKATAGGGTDGRYENKFNVNSFKGARQFSAIGMGNNTNDEGFSPLDILSFTGELNRMRQGGGNISINLSDPSSTLGLGGSNTGIRTIWGGGLNYNNIIGNKTDFTSNYFYNRYSPNTESHTQRQYFLPDSTYYYDQDAFNNNINNTHRLNLSADIQLDSFNSIKISPSFGYQHQQNAVYTDYKSMSPSQIKGSQGYSDNHLDNEGYNFRNDLLFRKKFRLKGRTFSFSLSTSLNQSNGDGFLTSVNNFYDHTTGLLQQVDSINQQNTSRGNLLSYNARAVYTEPILKRTLLELSLGNSYNHSSSDKTTFDLNKLNGKFDQLNPLLTNNYGNTYGFTNAGVRLRTQQRKFSAAAGLNWQRAELEGKIISGTKDSVITKTFYNLLPNARLQYNFTKYKSLSLYYTAITNQPNPSQLQPVPDISNPLNIQIGNPDLKQEYSHAMQFRFTSVNPFLNRNLFAFFTLRETQNKIVNYDIIDALGIKTTKPVNVNGVYDISGDINWGFPVHFLKASLNLGAVVGYNKGKQFINTVPNNISNVDLGPQIRLDMSPTSKFDVSLVSTFIFNDTKYSVQPSLNTKYLTQEYEATIDWQLPSNFYLHTDFNYIINSQRAAGFNTKVPLWNASLSKQVLHFNRGEIKLSAFDLLNQNVAISRNSNANYIEDIRTVNLQRFFMLSFTYSLSKNGLGGKSGPGGMRIIRKG